MALEGEALEKDLFAEAKRPPELTQKDRSSQNYR
jgi:hypothetical protein